MFGNIGWGEFAILLIAALVILGPERLPGAIGWVSKTMRQVRDYASGAQQQLKDELGPEFEDLRKPLADLQQLRGMSPRAVITKHLLDGDDSMFTDTRDLMRGATEDRTPSASKDTGEPPPAADDRRNQPSKPLGLDERPPFDLDAT